MGLSFLVAMCLTAGMVEMSVAARLFATTHGNGRAIASRIVELDPYSGDVIRYIGNTGVDINGVAYDSTSETLFAFSTTSEGTTSGSQSQHSLVTIDMETGRSSFIGSLTISPSDAEIEDRNFTTFMHTVADSNGQLFGWGITRDQSYSGLVSIDKSTGQATALSTYEYPAIVPPGSSLSFNSCGDLIFLEGFTSFTARSPMLFVIDTTNGTVTAARNSTGFGHHGKFKPGTNLLYSIRGTGGSDVIQMDYVAPETYALETAFGSLRTELISNVSRPGLHVLEFVDDGLSLWEEPAAYEAQCWDDITVHFGNIQLFNVTTAGEYTFSTCGSAIQTAITVLPVSSASAVCGSLHDGVTDEEERCVHCGPCGDIANRSEFTVTLPVGMYSIFTHATDQPDALPATYKLSISCPVSTWRDARPAASEYFVEERWEGKPNPLLTRARAKWQTRFYPTVKVFPPPLPYNGLDSACDVIDCPNCVDQRRCQHPTIWGGVECDTTCEVPTCVDRSMDLDSNCQRCNVDRTGCEQCRNEHYLLDGVCVAACPAETHLGVGNGFFNRICILGTCRRGLGNCNGCDATNTNCVECRDSKYLHNGKCVTSCPNDTISMGSGTTGRVCQERSPACSGSCHQCSADGSACVQCGAEQYLYNGTCRASCPIGLVEQGEGTFSRVCRTCIRGNAQSCHVCATDGSGCTMCRGGAYLHLRKCVTVCPDGFRGIGAGSYNNFCAAI